jgi:thiol-disulfide isomerase/thioredoxin
VALFAILMPGCDGAAPGHPAVGRSVGSLPLVSLADRSRPPPAFSGRVTLLNFFGTWCMPCRRELPGLARLAERLRSEPAFQLVAVSCGAGGPDDPDRLAALTSQFLAEQRLAIDAWADPEGRTRVIFQAAYGFDSFPSTYLIGPDGRIRAAWSGYRQRDEADMARAVVAALKELAAPAAEPMAAPAPPVNQPAAPPTSPPAAPAAR